MQEIISKRLPLYKIICRDKSHNIILIFLTIFRVIEVFILIAKFKTILAGRGIIFTPIMTHHF